MKFELGPAGEAALRLAFSRHPEPALTMALLDIENRAKRHFTSTLTDSLIGYTTLTLFFSTSTLERDRAEEWLWRQATNVSLLGLDRRRALEPEVVLPVFYHPSVAPDLEWLAEDKGLSIDEVIATHSGSPYFAYATGFAPGFCYLGTLHESLRTSRLATPRAKVPAGSVAIADSQTAVYPCESPGGWRLIGACTEPLFNLEHTPHSRLAVGITVQFEPIDEADFRKLGGLVP